MGRPFDLPRPRLGRRATSTGSSSSRTSPSESDSRVSFATSPITTPLTGLYNRRRFAQELERELASARRYETGGALLVIDLDNFKYMNDSAGHAAGDELIRAVANVAQGKAPRDRLPRASGRRRVRRAPAAFDS